jgi:hypothetical protein
MANTPTLLQRVAGCITSTLEIRVGVEFQTIAVDAEPKARIFAFLWENRPQTIAVLERLNDKVLVVRSDAAPMQFAYTFSSAKENKLEWAVCKTYNIKCEGSDVFGAVEDCVYATLELINASHTVLDGKTGLESTYTIKGDRTLKVTYTFGVGVLTEGGPDFETKMYVSFDADDYKDLKKKVLVFCGNKRKAEGVGPEEEPVAKIIAV